MSHGGAAWDGVIREGLWESDLDAGYKPQEGAKCAKVRWKSIPGLSIQEAEKAGEARWWSFVNRSDFSVPLQVLYEARERPSKEVTGSDVHFHKTPPATMWRASCRTSLVVQWLRIHLPMQGTSVPFLVQKIPHAASQYWSLNALEPMCLNKRRHHNEKPMHCNKE